MIFFVLGDKNIGGLLKLKMVECERVEGRGSTGGQFSKEFHQNETNLGGNG